MGKGCKYPRHWAGRRPASCPPLPCHPSRSTKPPREAASATSNCRNHFLERPGMATKSCSPPRRGRWHLIAASLQEVTWLRSATHPFPEAGAALHLCRSAGEASASGDASLMVCPVANPSPDLLCSIVICFSPTYLGISHFSILSDKEFII